MADPNAVFTLAEVEGVRLFTYTKPSSRLIIRSPLPSDAQNYADRYNDPTTSEFMPSMNARCGTYTADKTGKAINHWRTTSCKTSAYASIVLKESGQIIGDGGFGGIELDKERKTGDFGVVLSKEFRGRGYTVESMSLMLDLGFEELDLDEVTSQTDARNVAMRKVFEKLKLDGVEQRREGDGEVEWSLVVKKEDWESSF